jgi:hypothetical protein
LKPESILVLLLVAAGCADSTSGLPPGTRNVILSAVAEGVSGNAALVEETGGVSTVWVTLQGLEPGVSYNGRVGHGTCEDPGSDAISLARLSTSTAIGWAVTRNVPDSVLLAGFHIRYAGPGQPPPPVACGNID